MWLWGGLMLVVWAAIIGTLVWVASLPLGPGPTPPPDHTRKALEERFLRGEIDAQEYYDRLEALERSTAGRGGGEQPSRTSGSAWSKTTTASPGH
jgi:putative membrane protein